MSTEIQDLNESLKELETSGYDTSLIQDNKLIFHIDGVVYRVRLPNQLEQSLTEQRRNVLQLEFMKQEGCITKKQLIQKLKENNIVDIDALEQVKEELLKELKQIWLNLATKTDEEKIKIEEYTNKIKLIQERTKEITLDVANYLSPSLENRLEKGYIEYLTFLVTDKLIGENIWERLWKNIDEFNAADIRLTNNAIANTTWILLNKRI